MGERSAIVLDQEDRPGDDVIAFIRDAGLVAPESSPRFTALTGGVASDIWKVDAGKSVFVVKRALPRLRVAREWDAPVSRNASEVGWMKLANAVAPSISPRILAHDANVGAFAMEYFDPGEFPVWKRVLAAGQVDPAFAAKVGSAIAGIHAATARSDAVAREFNNGDVFHAIRLEPYFEEAGRVHADLASSLGRLVAETRSSKIALMHGDVSPKNILVGRGGPVLLDAECACYGEPAFDLAFCLNHLLLKCLMVPDVSGALLDSFDQLKDAYLHVVSWEPSDAIEARAARLLPALLLGRVDGKSPVEYITAEPDKDQVRRTARALLLKPVRRLVDVRIAWQENTLHD